MKDAIRKKLNSSGGASILMALLLLLVAVMVSAVILAAAISAAKTIRTDREQQQTYLTVSSAAGLVRDSILNGSGDFESVEKTVKTEQKRRTVSRGGRVDVGNWIVSSSTTSSPEFSSNPANGNFSTLMNAAIQSAMQNSVPYSSKLTIQSEDGKYETVTADFLLQKEQSGSGANVYVLTVTFTGGVGDHLCKMKLTMQGSEKAETSSSTSEVYSNFYRRDRYGELYPQNMTETTISTTTTSINWTQDKATITRERVVEE